MTRHELVIRISLPRWSRRRMVAVLSAVGMLVAVAAYAVPWPYNPPTFTMMEKLSSSKMTNAFAPRWTISVSASLFLAAASQKMHSG